ncbi:MAG: Eco57I restriction-modification methylase domain-containing protein [Lachnospiraceae bacterium]|nr:Eco57I restriction-modification methylase domain-containing protein [Lachnospiraceae bacterium]
MITHENEDLLAELITGRVKPHIYAFTTNTIPNYLKVGDTYRPVFVRLREWMQFFPNLQKEFEDSAAINDDIFFRDYSVHQYLEGDLSKHRLEPQEYPDLYYSNEFFRDVQVEHVADAINDIRKSYELNTGKYKFYDANSHLPETYTYASTGVWTPRPNQQDTIDRFVAAVKSGRTNLLMYAVMRFGKSFTSLCCAKSIDAKIVLVVSAKADVREEWKKTVQSADNFNQDYVFITSDDLVRDQSAISSVLSDGKGAVVFLTLQDLQGDNIKDKHQDIFGQQIDLLIVDETHYGARAESYGKVLRSVNYEKDVKEKHANDDFVEIKDAEDQLKALSVKITLHLSGTPYRILMGNEFSKEDIIAFYQFSDIVKDQERWDEEHLLNDAEDVKEWENPYFGFPQMVRFAFVPSKSALAILDSLKNSGTTYAFSALLKPQSISKDPTNSLHKKFVYEKEVLELFEAIDGSRDDEGLLSFLDYDKIKDGKMCQHIVCVLPYCASCDALESLIESNRENFKNLKDYEIINISGVDSPNEYRSVQAVKAKIKQCAAEGKKTLTLTVNRMLTGSTVEEWDTMIFLKDTASPQEYDQAIFRLQNQYIREYVGTDGDTIRYNMKPQTLLVDFDPHRMFVMQEQKSQIYNANTDASGNEHLRDRLQEELRISPIITVNRNRIEQVEATDILAEISEYSSSRGVLDETKDIPVDMSLLNLDVIKAEIESQAELGSRQGLSVDAHKGEESDLDNHDEGNGNQGGQSDPGQSGGDPNEADGTDNDTTSQEEDNKSLENKFRTYYSRILFFAFLTKSSVSSLDGIIQCMDHNENERIAKNLFLEKSILSLIRDHMNIFVQRQLDYKIQNMNTLSHDESVEPMKRAAVAIRKFGRISDSEITTPEQTASAMIDLIPDDYFAAVGSDADARILDIASKMGEFAVAVVKRCNDLGIPVDDIKERIVSIPTSSIAYEFTRKVYEVLGLDVGSIAEKFNSYDLLKIRKTNEDGTFSDKLDYEIISDILYQKKRMSTVSLSDDVDGIEEVDRVKFSAIVGNPPYQEADGGAGVSSRAIYPYFVDIARNLNPSSVSIIIPTRWFAGGKNLDDFRDSMLNDIHIRELHDCLHPEEIFPNTNNRGGICYFLWDNNYNNTESKMKVVTHEGGGVSNEYIRDLKIHDMDIFFRNNKAITILDKVITDDNVPTLKEHISAAKAFGFRTFFISDPRFRATAERLEEPIKCFGRAGKVGFVERHEISSHTEWIDRWKVFIPESNNIGTELNDDNQNSFVGAPKEICTESFLCVGADLSLNEESANNLSRYLRTKFARFLLSLAKISQHGTGKTYRFVPVVDFSEEWTDEKLYAKYNLTQEEIDLIESSIKPMA